MKKIAVAVAIAAVLTTIGISVLTGLNGGTAKAADATYVPGKKCIRVILSLTKHRPRLPTPRAWRI
jgi:hypothetical protein